MQLSRWILMIVFELSWVSFSTVLTSFVGQVLHRFYTRVGTQIVIVTAVVFPNTLLFRRLRSVSHGLFQVGPIRAFRRRLLAQFTLRIVTAGIRRYEILIRRTPTLWKFRQRLPEPASYANSARHCLAQPIRGLPFRSA